MGFTAGFVAGGSPDDVVAEVIVPTAANYTVPGLITGASILRVSSLVDIGAQRDIILPLVRGLCFGVVNLTTGAFAIQIISASGTGIVIADASAAIVYCDGTNWRRLTADVVAT